jgi:hypothetical protein
MREQTAEKELNKLLHAKSVLHPKRGYLVYVARYGRERVISGPKGEGGRYFFEVPIVLEQRIPKAKMKEWTGEFRLWAKYALEKA